MVDFGTKNWTPQHICPTKTMNRKTCQEIEHFAWMCRSKQNKQRHKMNKTSAEHRDIFRPLKKFLLMRDSNPRIIACEEDALPTDP